MDMGAATHKRGGDFLHELALSARQECVLLTRVHRSELRLMRHAKILRIYLNRSELQRARSGNFRVVSVISQALERQGFRVELRRNSDEERLKSAQRNGYSLFHMQDPFHDRALSLRLAYIFPYWRVENTAERWEFDVARTQFSAKEHDWDRAADWAADWRRWLFKITLDQVSFDGPIYVPLQGRLLLHRSFQAASPQQMLEDVLARFPKDTVLAGLHPNEEYSSSERAMLAKLCDDHPRLSVVTGQMNAALKTCRFVVSQNSSAAFFGYFHHKPAVLYGRSDFHHIASNVHMLGVDGAYRIIQDMRPDFDAYLRWFTAQNTIKADEKNAGDALLERLREHGWRVD